MNEDVVAKLDVLIGMVQGLEANHRSLKASVQELQADSRTLKESVQGLQADNRSLKDSMKDLKESMYVQGERISRMEGRLDEQSRVLVALIPTQLAAVPRPAA
jgi:peptidoglycan hydrolase CwlO-like protein